MKLSFSLILLFLLTDTVVGQYFPAELWHEGYLVTTDGDTLRGSIKYNLDNDAVQLENHNRIQTFTGRNMTSFEVYDKITENYRQFYSIPYAVNMEYKVPRLFEMLYLGELTLVAREIIVQESISPTISPAYGTRERLSYKFYFVYKDGKMADFDGKRATLFDIMRDKSRDVKNYVKKNNLRTDRLQDLVRVTAFYNSL